MIATMATGGTKLIATSPSTMSIRRRITATATNCIRKYGVRITPPWDEHTDSLHVRDGPGHEVSGVMAIVKLKAEVLNVVVERVAKIIDDKLRQGLAQICLAKGQNAAQGTEGQDSYAQREDRPIGNGIALKGKGDLVYGVAKEPGEDQVGSGAARHASVCGSQVPLVADC